MRMSTGWKCGPENICPSVQQSKAARWHFSGLISNMKALTFIFLLLSGAGLAHGFPVRPSQGGNGTAKLFYCKDPGCAEKVKKLFCNDELISDDIHMAECAGAPPLNVVCRLDGRAFVSAEGNCEFEEKANQIHTEICTDENSICRFPNAAITSASAITSAPTTTDDDANTGHIIGGVVGGIVVLILIVLGVCVYKKFNNSRQQTEEAL